MINEGREHKTYGVVLVGAIISCFIAFFNCYPLVFPDTGSYLHSGWDNVVFNDRTIFYGLFLYGASLGGSVMLIVVFQGLMISFVLYHTLSIFFVGLRLRLVFLSIITFLSLFTGYSYTVSVLIPDIFASITLLAFVNLLLNNHMKLWRQVLTALIFVFSICTQLSTLPILMFVCASVFVFLIWRTICRKPVLVSFRRFIGITALGLSALVIIPAVHYHYDGQYKISGGKHVFIVNHLLEIGVLEDYLDEVCDKKHYKICQYKDSLGWDFMWAGDGPLAKTGGWKANRKEYNSIIRDIMTTDRYFWRVASKGVEYSVKQFFTFQTTVSPSQMSGSAPYDQIQWRLPDTTREYVSSLQNSNKLDLRFVNTAELPIIMISMLILFCFVLSPALFSTLLSTEKRLICLVLAYTVGSAVICSNLSTIHARFQNRIVWLLPVLVVIIGCRMWFEKRSTQAAD